MIDDNKFLLELRSLVNTKDLDLLVNKLELDNGCSLSMDTLLIRSSNKGFSKCDVNLKGIFKNCFKIYLYCKLKGYMGIRPNNSGENSFFSKLRVILETINLVSENDVTSMLDITNSMIKKAIEYMFKDGQSVRTVRLKLSTLSLVIKENDKLPSLLTINPNVLNGIDSNYLNNEFTKYNSLNNNQLNNLDELISNKIPYEIADMKILISKAKEVFTYKDEILELLSIIVKSKEEGKSSNIRSKYIYESLRKMNAEGKIFTFNIIRDWQLKCVEEKSFYKYGKYGKYKGRSIEGPFYNNLLLTTEYLEAACIALVLIGTAMRSSEFLFLPKDIKFTEAEHPGLVRTIFKTSSSNDGDEYDNPIPRICKDCLETLIKISDIKYGDKNKYLLSPSIHIDNSNKGNGIRNQRLNVLIKSLSDYCELDRIPTSHQFRHIMAYLVTSADTTHGLEMASMLLGHKSLKMTIHYLSLFNKDLDDALVELSKSNSGKVIDKLCDAIQRGEKIFGMRAELLMPEVAFVGKISEKFTLSLNRELRELVENDKFAIIQTTHCMCIHDLSKTNDMKCQLGFDIHNLNVVKNPYVSRCKGSSCKSAIFLEEDINKLNSLHIEFDDEIKKRLEKNTYIIEAGGLNNLVPHSKLIKDYENHKNQKII